MDHFQAFSLLRIYLEMGVLLFLGFILFSLGVKGLFRLRFGANSSHFVRIGYFILGFSILLPIFFLALPRSTLFRPSAQVWSSGKSMALTSALLPSSPAVDRKSSTIRTGISLSENTLLVILATIGMISFVFILVFIQRLWAFHRSLSDLPVIRKIGRVSIRVSDTHPVAFSTWIPRRATIVIPIRIIENRSDFHLTLAHEIQHHRHGDTRWLYFAEILKAFFFWNPGVYGISRLISQLQEFACDEFLIGRRKYSSQAYGSCLIRAAESTIGTKSVLVGTASMAAINNPSLLKRRIEMILARQKKRSNWAPLFAIGIGVLMTSVSYAAESALQLKKLSLEEAKKYEDLTREIPIQINDLVLEKLNHFVGTPEGNSWAKAALARMNQGPRPYHPMIVKKINSYGLPQDLIAIPLLESGFQNLPPTPPQKGAGIWEFIAETAKRYNLKVSSQKEVTEQNDERLNPEKETVAAMRYLRDLHDQFKDWRLAIKAYNEGENRVQKLIHEHGTKDPWVLEKKSSTEGYLSGVIAMIILFNHQELLN